MNEQNGFERLVADQLSDAGVGTPPASAIEETVTRARGSRRLPEWLALVREPPMRTNDHLVVGSPTFRATAIVIATLLLAVTLAAAGIAGQRLIAAGPIVVAADGSGDFATVAEALEVATDGDRIAVRPGTYWEALRVDVGVSIRGDGDRARIVLAAPPDSPTVSLLEDPSDEASLEYDVPMGIELAAPGIALEGLTVRGPTPGVAIAVTAGDAYLADLAVGADEANAEETGDPALDTRLGVIAMGSSTLTLRDNDLSAAVEVTEDAAAVIEHNRLADSIVQGFSSRPFEVRDNVLSGGAIVASGDTATIEDNRLSDAFIAIDGDGYSLVSSNTLEGLRYDAGPGIGISLWDAANADILENTITDAATGIKTQFYFGAATIADNDVTGSSVGISVGSYGMELSRNTVTDSKVIGVEVFNAGPSFTDNTITGNTAGLHLGSSRDVVLSGNTICDNGTNVRVVTGEMPDMSGNEVCPDTP